MQISNFTLLNSSTNFPTAMIASRTNSDSGQVRIAHISNDGNEVVWISNEDNIAPGFPLSANGCWVWNRQNETHTLISLPYASLNFDYFNVNLVGSEYIIMLGYTLTGSTLGQAYAYNRTTGVANKVPTVSSTVISIDNGSAIYTDPTGRYVVNINSLSNPRIWLIYDNVGQRTLGTISKGNSYYPIVLTNYIVMVEDYGDPSKADVYNLSGGLIRSLNLSSDNLGNAYYADSWTAGNGNYVALSVTNTGFPLTQTAVRVWDVTTGQPIYTTPVISASPLYHSIPQGLSEDGTKLLYTAVDSGSANIFKAFRYDNSLGLLTNLSRTLSADGMFISMNTTAITNPQVQKAAVASSTFNYYGFKNNTLNPVTGFVPQAGLVSYNGIWPLLTYLSKRLLGYF